MSAAIASGGALPALLAAIQERERRRTDAAQRVARAEALTRTVRIEAKQLERVLLRADDARRDAQEQPDQEDESES